MIIVSSMNSNNARFQHRFHRFQVAPPPTLTAAPAAVAASTEAAWISKLTVTEPARRWRRRASETEVMVTLSEVVPAPGPARYCSLRHGMTYNSMNQSSKCVSNCRGEQYLRCGLAWIA